MSGSRGLELVMAQSPFIVPLRRDPPPAHSHDRVSGWEGNMDRSDSRAQRAGMIPRLSSQNFIRRRKNLMIPGAFGSEITTIPQMDEVLRRHRHLLGLQVRNDRRARSSAARLKPDRTPERCSRGLRRAPLLGAYAYRYRHRPDEVCVWDRQSFRFL